MSAALLRFMIQHRVLVTLVALTIGLLGVIALARLPIDAVPDITNKQVQVNVVLPALPPLDIERQVTFPIESAMAGIPGLERTWSISRNGFGQVTVVFTDDTDLYFARQQVVERLAEAKDSLPPGAEPVLGPVSTGLGEVFMYGVSFAHPGGTGATVTDGSPGWQTDGSYLTPEGEHIVGEADRLTYLRTIQDWIISPQLRSVADVAGVDSIGGFQKQYVVTPDPDRMQALGISFRDLADAVERNNQSVGAGTIAHHGEAYVVRADGRVRSVEDLAGIAITTRKGTPILLRDVAAVGLGRELRTGSASRNGQETVVGTALMIIGGNSRAVAAASAAKLASIAPSLPPDVVTTPLINRAHLVDGTIATVRANLIEGAALVVVVLFALLGNLRGALIAALIIPLSMFLAAIGMTKAGISGNLMSLGAIDFGIIVDSAVILVENCIRRLGARQEDLGRRLSTTERLHETYEASREMVRPTLFGQIIIITVYLPVLCLSGVEGKTFYPMAATVVFALVAALVLTLTLVPALVGMCLRGDIQHRENMLMRAASSAYRPVLGWSIRWRWLVLGVAVVIFAGSVWLFSRLGREFTPRLEEGDIDAQAERIAATDIEQSTRMQQDIERALQTVPEVAYVFSKTGTTEVATDPMPPNRADTLIILKPRAQWSDPQQPKAAVEAKITKVLARLPGTAFTMSQPIEDRFNELLAGVRADVAIKVFGDRFEDLLPSAKAIAKTLATVPGASDIRVEQVTGAPALDIAIDRAACSRLGLAVADVQQVVSMAIGGQGAGVVYEGDRRFDIVMRLGDLARCDLEGLRCLPVPLPSDSVSKPSVPLSSVASLQLTEGLNQVSRENGKRRITVQCNVRGRDLGSFVTDAQQRIATEVKPVAGTWIAWGGRYENLEAARARLGIVVPACLVLILGLLFMAFNSVKYAVLVFSGVPLALTGGVAALWFVGLPFSITAAVGFIALSGVAVLNGLVVVSHINHLRHGGAAVEAAIADGSLTRLRPMLMTALVGCLGYVPMALATGQGAEVQKPLAVVVIGGILSSAILTLIVLPALYRLWHRADDAWDTSGDQEHLTQPEPADG